MVCVLARLMLTTPHFIATLSARLLCHFWCHVAEHHRGPDCGLFPDSEAAVRVMKPAPPREDTEFL